MTYRKKLIEVALPLEAINKASAREKSIRHGHPSTLHLWWARRPLAACRAVLFSQIVDDPSSHPDKFPTEEAQQKERQRLFGIIEDLVKWENTTNEDVLRAARNEIIKSCDGDPPPVLDPFCGGGSIPLEAQRLGLKAYGSDLNPVAVLITKALIEIPPKFANRPPVHPMKDRDVMKGEWHGAAGLAEDVRYYGKWMRDEAEKRIGHLYPKAKLPKELQYRDKTGKWVEEATVIAWLWARTVKCPNPACGATMPLVRSFWLSTKKGKKAWVEPIIDREAKTVRFQVKTGEGQPPEGTVNRNGATCICCGASVPLKHVRSEGKAGRMSAQLMAIVAKGQRGRTYLAPSEEHVAVTKAAQPSWKPDQQLQGKCRVSVPLYGMDTFGDLFTPRQLVALTTFSDLVGEAREKVLADAIAAGMPDDGKGIDDGGTGAAAYADAVATYLAFAVDKAADYWSSICTWHVSRQIVRNTFGRQAIPMVWDYAECCPFSQSTGNWGACYDWVWKALLTTPSSRIGYARQLDAVASYHGDSCPLTCTDPPYYDNIGYADLSDYFYIWLRASLANVYMNLFSTLLVPKNQELVATPYRFGGDKREARRFFEHGLGEAFQRMRESHAPDYPMTVFYAFKQSEPDSVSPRLETGDSGTRLGSSPTMLKHGVNAQRASTGWETMLEGLLRSGFSITGTWPMRSELGNRPVAVGTSALASSIVLVCRPRPSDAPLATRREFITALRAELPDALKKLQEGNIAPVDFAQAAIGPGMSVFSRYAKVLEADGTPMTVRTALAIINEELDAYLTAQEGEMDSDTRFCLAWFESFGMADGPFGEADVLARAKNTSVDGLARAGVLHSEGGNVRILGRDAYPDDWDPASNKRLTVWECAQHLIKRLEQDGEVGAAKLARALGGRAEDAKELAYRLYTICERKKWAQEALAYNGLVIAWPEITKLARSKREPARQRELGM